MRGKDYVLKKNLPTFILAGVISLSGLGLLIFEQNNYSFSIFEAGITKMEKTITIEEDGDVRFQERTDRYLDYSAFFQDLYFTSDNEDVSKTQHTPQFDTSYFGHKIYDSNGQLLIEGDGTQEVVATVNDNFMKLSYSWLDNPTDEFGDRIRPIDDESVAIFQFNDGLWGEATFEYDYTIRGVALKYADTAEFFWVVAATDDMKTTNVDVDIVLPTTSIDLDDVDVYLRGSNLARVQSVEKNELGQVVINVQASQLYPGEFITTRINFPASALTILSNEFGNDVTNLNLGDSTHLENVARYEAERANARMLYDLADWLGGLHLLFVLVFAAFQTRRVYLKFDKEHPTDFYGEYYRELPQPYEPAIMGYLYRFKQNEKDDVTATLMDLVRRQFITIDAGTESLTDKNANYTLVLNKNKDQSSLKAFEKQLIQWFFGLVAGGQDRLTLKQLESFTKKENQAVRYMNENQAFNRQVNAEAKAMNFFDDVKVAAQASLWFLGLMSLLAGAYFVLRLVLAYGTYTGVMGGILSGVVLAIGGYARTIERRSVKGNEDFVRWAAFEKFLKEFTNIKDYSMPGITLWEHYMVYAISFGIADLVEQQLRFKYQKLNRMDELNSSPYFRYPGFYRRYYYGMNQSFTNATRTIAQAQAQRNNSAGGGRFGGGGGFSGGGGSGARLR